MLRSLISQLRPRRSASHSDQPRSPLFEPGAVAFVADIPELTRVTPKAPLYADLASVRLRTVPVAAGMAASRPVYLVPLALIVNKPILDLGEGVEAIVITKSSTGHLINDTARFEALIKWLPLAARSTRLFADVTDNYEALGNALGESFLTRYQRALGEFCTLVVSCDSLKQELAPYAKRSIHVIEDTYESPRVNEARLRVADPVRLCWFGRLSPPTLDAVVPGMERIATALRERAAELTIVTNGQRRELVYHIGARLCEVHPNCATRFIPWSLQATWQALDECDLVILPQDHRDPWGRVKSHNRLVESIRAGRLAIASPIPSYVELADYAWVGEDLAEGIDWALSNPEAAEARVRAGQQAVEARFAPQRIVAKWMQLLADEHASPPAAAQSIPVPKDANGVRLNLGCGDKILPGYVNVDVAPSRAGKSPDVLCDLHALAPFESDSVDEVLAVHVVEHFWRWEIVAVLKEWLRVLKPEGRMILECPNLLTACEELLKDPAAAAGPGPEGQRSMWVFYGDPAWRDPLMSHRWNYTPQSLAAVMAEAGLVNIRQEPAQYKLREPRDMRIVGEKPPA
jgi:glycosyltransferase involved in cell wall biosynthesis